MNRTNYARTITPNIFLFILLLASLSACRSTTPTDTVIFDSGQGTGHYDNMTYVQYESLITFTPQENITARSINPQITYCNGSCGYIVCILSDQNAGPLACQTGLIDANNQDYPQLPERYLDSQVQFNTGLEYQIYIRVWTTKSVGIYTTGDRTTGVTGAGIIKVNFARSDIPFYGIPSDDNLDRGGISFQHIY